MRVPGDHGAGQRLPLITEYPSPNEGFQNSDMNLIRNPLASIAVLLSVSAISPASADQGSEAVSKLEALYYSAAQDCGSSNRPAFLCSGLVLSTTAPSMDYQFYGVSPANQARGGVSVSYLRQDAKFSALAKGAKTGFIFNPALANPVDHADYNVLCAFPVAGATESRKLNGCGDSSLTKAVEKSCDQMGIATGEQWLASYRKNGSRAPAQCSFDTRIGTANSAPKFYQNLQAIRVLGEEALASANEMILAPWNSTVPRSPSVMALFYTDDSALRASRLSQIQWFQATGWLLPMVKMQLPKTASQDAVFGYDAMQQAIYPAGSPNQCAQYVQNADWVVRYDPGFKKNIATLSILPTSCGRAIQEGQTNHFFNELVSKYYLQPEWINNADNQATSIPAMRRQLICHLMIARGKDYYNIEPSRPLTDQASTNAAGCNNI